MLHHEHHSRDLTAEYLTKSQDFCSALSRIQNSCNPHNQRRLLERLSAMLQAAGAAKAHTEASGPTIACLAECSRRSRCHSRVAGWASATTQLCVRGH